MSDRMRFRYFIAAGKSLEICQTIEKERAAAYKLRAKLAKEFGADGTYGTDRAVPGFFKSLPKGKDDGFVKRGNLVDSADVAAPPPEGFNARFTGAGEGRGVVWTPNKKTTVGKEAAKRFDDESLYMPDHYDFSSRLGGGQVLQRSKLYYPFFYRLCSPKDREIIIRVPTACLPKISEFGKQAGGVDAIVINGMNEEDVRRGQFVPPDAIPLKTSEYWQRVEAWEAKAGKPMEDVP